MSFSFKRLKPKTEKVETLHLMILSHDLRRGAVRREIETSLRALAALGKYGKLDVHILGPLEDQDENDRVFLTDEVVPKTSVNVIIRNVDISSYISPALSEDPKQFMARAIRLRDAIIELGNLQLYSEYTPYTEKNPLFIWAHDLPVGLYPVLTCGFRQLALWLSERELAVLLINHIHNFGEERHPEQWQALLDSAGGDLQLARQIAYPTLGNVVYMADTLDDCLELLNIGVAEERIFQLTPATDAEQFAGKLIWELTKTERERLDQKLADVEDIRTQLLEEIKWRFPGADPEKPCLITSPTYGRWNIGEIFLIGQLLSERETELLVPYLEENYAARFRRYQAVLGAIARFAEDWQFPRIERKVSSTFQVQFLEPDLLQIFDGSVFPGADSADLALSAICRADPFIIRAESWLMALKREGVVLEGKYNSLTVRAKDVNVERLEAAYFAKVNETRALLRLEPLSAKIFKKLFEKHKIQDDLIFFADLDEAGQIETISKVKGDEKFAQDFLKRNRTLEEALDSLGDFKKTISPKNTGLIEKRFGLKTRCDELRALFGSVMQFLEGDLSEKPDARVENQRLVERGVSLAAIRLL